VIFVTRLNVVAVDPETGKVQFRFPFGQRGPTVNAATPLVLKDHLFVTASYGIGAQFVRIGAASPKTVWESDEVMSSQYTTCVEKDGYLYGLDGRQDGPPANLRCINPQTGKVVWNKESFGAGNLILADDKLLIMKIDGELVLAEASPSGYKELAAATVFASTVQPLPALANGCLYARDTNTLKCVDLRK
jgi:outer membrane protein assembly factor BamB